MPSTPAVVAIDMGYGHLRAARPLAQLLHTEVLEVDRPPLASPEEAKRWHDARSVYEAVSRGSQVPFLGTPFRFLLDTVTSIPHLYPYRDLSSPTLPIRIFERMIHNGFGDGLARFLRESRKPLLTTFYAPALIADYHGHPDVYCVVTDTDMNRIWAPIDPHQSRIHYFAPSLRAMRRLRFYGVPESRVHFTGFPLPHALLGGPSLPVLKRNLAARLVRLDPSGAFRDMFRDEVQQFLGPLPESTGEAPLLTFAVGGAGAQAEMVELMLPTMRHALFSHRMRLALVAGVRREVADYFERIVDRAGLKKLLGTDVRIIVEDTRDAYFSRFESLLAETDILYTKPSELTFYAALGIPLVCARPVGHHEQLNRRFLLEAGAGLKQWDPRHAAAWLGEWLSDGTLASAAWSGFMRLPKTGTYRILERLGAPYVESDQAQPLMQST